MSTGSLRLLAAALTASGLLTLGAPRSAEATSLFVDLVGHVFSVPDELQSEFSVDDPVSLHFEIRLDAQDVYPDRSDLTELPLGLVNMELDVGAFSTRAVWGSLLALNQPLSWPSTRFTWGTHARFSNATIERSTWYEGSPQRDWLGLGQVGLRLAPGGSDSVDPANLMFLLDIDMPNVVGWLRFYRPLTDEWHSLDFHADQFLISVPEPGTSLSLSLAALGLAGLWRQGRRRSELGSR